MGFGPMYMENGRRRTVRALCVIAAYAVLLVQLIAVGLHRVDEEGQDVFFFYWNRLEVFHKYL